MNESGIQPVEYKVLIKPEVVEAKTAGGLYLPEQSQDKEKMAQVRGALVAIGGNAFEDWCGPPSIGDNVYFAKYAGYVVKGVDGEEYRLANDKDIAAIIRG
jgi:chaperonin GroES